MNKILKGILAAVMAVAMLTFVSCENGVGGDNGEKASLTVSPTSVTLLSSGSEQFITVETNADDWDFMSGASWLLVEKMNAGLFLRASENTNENERSGELVVFATLNGSRAEQIISVKQLGKNDTPSSGSGLFECPVFESLMLSSYDANGDGTISEVEAEGVTEIDVAYTEENAEEREAITSLKGIKIFKNLQYLYCENNLIKSLDVSGMQKLEYVDCFYNEMETLDVSNCPSLKWVYCFSNKLTSVKVEGSNNMTFFQAYNNKLTSLDFSDMPELYYFDVRLNALRDVDFSNCPKLGIAAVGSNDIASLNLEGLPSLESLGCYSNSIASLDLSKLPKLYMLECYDNNLATLNLSANMALETLNCQNNLLKELVVGNKAIVTTLNCANNYLEGDLDLTDYAALKHLLCGGNNFTSIEVASCTKLEDINCANTSIKALDVSALSLLTSLKANDCLISEMDCSNNSALATLHLQGNPLTSLVLAEGQKINDLKVDNPDVISYK